MEAKSLLSYLCISTALCSFSPVVWGMDDDNIESSFLILNKEKQKPQDFFYEDNDISEYLEAFFQHSKEFSLFNKSKYLLSSKKKEFCPIRDQIDGKNYIVAVTNAVDTQSASVNIEYFLDKDSRKHHMKGEDEQEKILKEFICFKPTSQENAYTELLQKIKTIKEEEFKKSENRLESIDTILNRTEKNFESTIKAFQEALEIRQKEKEDVFDEILPHLVNPQETYAKILFPYNITNFHWLTGEICIHRAKGEYDIKVYAHDPYGKGQMGKINFFKIKEALQKRIKEHDLTAKFKSIESSVSPYGSRQQSGDIISCGVITAQDLIKRITGQPIEETIDLKKAKELREHHIEMMRKVNPKAAFIQRNEAKIKFLNEKGEIWDDDTSTEIPNFINKNLFSNSGNNKRFNNKGFYEKQVGKIVKHIQELNMSNTQKNTLRQSLAMVVGYPDLPLEDLKDVLLEYGIAMRLKDLSKLLKKIEYVFRYLRSDLTYPLIFHKSLNKLICLEEGKKEEIQENASKPHRKNKSTLELRFVEKIDDPIRFNFSQNTLETKGTHSSSFSPELVISENELQSSSQLLIPFSSLSLDSPVLPPLMKGELETLNQRILTIMEAEVDVYEQAKRELENYQKKETTLSLEKAKELKELLISLTPPEETLKPRKHDLELNAPPTPKDERLKSIHRNIERVASFLSELAPKEHKELIKALDAAKEAYTFFLQKICTIDFKTRIALLSPRARLIQEDGRPYLVPVALAREIIAKDIWNKKIETNQEGGQSTVVGKGGVHFKDGSASVNGLKPPFEWAAYSFAQLLLGSGFTPATSTFSLEKIPFWSLKKDYERPINGLETPQTLEGKEIKNRLNEKVFFAKKPLTLEAYFDEYHSDYEKLETIPKNAYIQTTFSSGKESLFEFLERRKNNQQEELNIRSYSGFFILSLIMNFTDAKDDNIRVTEDNKLISIDNDRVFGNMLVTDGKGNHWAEAKNVLFLMQEEIEKPVDDFIAQKFLHLDVDVILLEWLKACAYQNAQYKVLYEYATLPEQCEESFIRFQPHTILKLKERFQKIQKLLGEKREKPLTHDNLFKTLHPYTSTYYKALRKIYPDPHEAQQRLWKAPFFEQILQESLDALETSPHPSLSEIFGDQFFGNQQLGSTPPEELEPPIDTILSSLSGDTALSIDHLIESFSLTRTSSYEEFLNLFDKNEELSNRFEKAWPNNWNSETLIDFKVGGIYRSVSLKDLEKGIPKDCPLAGQYEKKRTADPLQEASVLLSQMDIAIKMPEIRLKILDFLEGWIMWPDHWNAEALYTLGLDILKSGRLYAQSYLERILNHKNFDPSAIDRMGNTLLHYWVKSVLTNCETDERENILKERKEYAQNFLTNWQKKGGKLDSLNKKGESILDIAFQHGREEVVKLLLQSKRKIGEEKSNAYNKENKKIINYNIKEEKLTSICSLPYYEKNLEFFYHKAREKKSWVTNKNTPNSLRALFRAKKEQDPFFQWTLQRSKILTLAKQGVNEKVELITRNPGQIKSENQSREPRFETEARYLTPQAQSQLWDQKGTFQAIHENSATQRKVGWVIPNEDKIIKDIQNKNSAKVRHSRIYFKQNPASAGTSLSIMELEAALFGAPSLPITFAKIKKIPFTLSPGVGRLIKDTGKEVKKPFPSLKYSWSEAGSFHKILKTEDPTLKAYHPLDKQELEKTILMALLTNPEDDKPSNFILEKMKGRPSYKIIGVDTEQAFVPSVEKPPSEMKGYIVRAKSILYCLDQMMHKPSQDLFQKIQRWNPVTMMKDWVTTLKEVHYCLHSLFTKKEHLQLEKQESPVGILFGKGDIGRFIKKLLNLQSFTKDNLDFMTLFQKVEPFIAQRYKPILKNPLQQHPPFKRFDIIDGPTYEKNRPVKDKLLSMFVSKDDHQSSISSTLIGMARNLSFDPETALEEIAEEFVHHKGTEELLKFQKKDKKHAEALSKILNGIKFEKISLNLKFFSPQEQNLILEPLKFVRLVRLGLRYSSTLTPALLKQFQLYSLIHLNLTGWKALDLNTLDLIIQKCSHLETLNISSCSTLASIADPKQPLIPFNFSNIKKLLINQCASLKMLNFKANKLEYLESQSNLNLTFFKIHGPSLKHLNVSNSSNITDNMLDELGEAAPMATINCSGCSHILLPEFRLHWPFAEQKILEKGALKQIKEVYEKKRTSLDLWSNIGVGGVISLSNTLKYNMFLTELSLRHGKLGSEGLKVFTDMLKYNTTLTSLTLEINEIGDEEAKDFAKFLEQNTALIKLSLEANNISDEGAKAFAKALKYNTTLKSLNLQQNKISDEGSKTLAKNTSLLELHLYSNNISDIGAEALAANRTLISLNLSSNKIGDMGAEALAQNTVLTQLDLGSNKITDKGAKLLAKNTNLLRLYLWQNKIGDEGAEDLGKNSTLLSLSLSDNKIGPKGAKALAQNINLKKLELFGNNIGDEGAKALAQNTTLTSLTLRDHKNINKIGDEGAKAFGGNKTLSRLNLERNNITDEGARGLALNSTLTELYLRSNHIGTEGAKALSQNTTLTSLDLYDNKIEEEGATAFLQNTTLTSLDLYYNNPNNKNLKIDLQTLTLISQMLERNKMLKKEEEEKKKKNENN